MKIGLIVAMDSEFELIKQIFSDLQNINHRYLTLAKGNVGNNEIVLIKGGIGKVNAAAATVELINMFDPKIVINTGIAGGIDKKVNVMDVVLGEKVIYHDVWCGEGNEYGQIQGLPAKFVADDNLMKAALSCKTNVRVVKGTIVSGDRFVSAPDELYTIKNLFTDALAVDMESAAIGQVCHLYNRPFLAIRIISDTPGIDNHYQQYLNFWEMAPQKSAEIIKELLNNL